MPGEEDRALPEDWQQRVHPFSRWEHEVDVDDDTVTFHFPGQEPITVANRAGHQDILEVSDWMVQQAAADGDFQQLIDWGILKKP